MLLSFCLLFKVPVSFSPLEHSHSSIIVSAATAVASVASVPVPGPFTQTSSLGLSASLGLLTCWSALCEAVRFHHFPCTSVI